MRFIFLDFRVEASRFGVSDSKFRVRVQGSRHRDTFIRAKPLVGLRVQG